MWKLRLKKKDILIPAVLLMLSEGSFSAKELARFVYILDKSRHDPDEDLPALEQVIEKILLEVLQDYISFDPGHNKFHLSENIGKAERKEIQRAIFIKTVNGFFVEVN